MQLTSHILFELFLLSFPLCCFIPYWKLYSLWAPQTTLSLGVHTPFNCSQTNFTAQLLKLLSQAIHTLSLSSLLLDQTLNLHHHFCCLSTAAYSFLVSILSGKLIKEEIKYLDVSYIFANFSSSFVVLFRPIMVFTLPVQCILKMLKISLTFQ